MLHYTHRPAYRLECRNTTCSWSQTYFFDQQTPGQCPRCNRPAPKRHVLLTGKGYDHKKDYKRAV